MQNQASVEIAGLAEKVRHARMYTTLNRPTDVLFERRRMPDRIGLTFILP